MTSRAGPQHSPAWTLNLPPSPFLCKGLGGCWQGSREQALYIPLREAPRHHVLRMLVFTHPWVFQLHPESPCPTSRRLFPRPHPQGHPGALASEGRFIKVFQFFFTFKSVPKRKDHFAMVLAALVMDLVVFLSVRTFLLHWSQPRAHSILLFVDFGPMYFMGIDTYINI